MGLWILLQNKLYYFFERAPVKWLSTATILADLAMRGFAISFSTLAYVAFLGSFLTFLSNMLLSSL